MRPQEVYEKFSEVSSFEHAPLQLLLGAYAALSLPRIQNVFKSNRHRLFSQASISAEISMHQEASVELKRRYSERAHSLFLAQSVDEHFVVGDVYTEPLRAHLPLYKAMPSPERLPESLAQSLFRITDTYTNADSTSHIGFACEIASSMIFNGMERYGIRSYPAFVRQDSGVRTQFNTHFDAIVESDGSTIESGRYPVQIKASKLTGKGAYHPAITKISFENITNLDPSDLHGAMASLALSCLVSIEPNVPMQLFTPEYMSENVLEALGKKPPLDQDMLLTSVVVTD